VFPFKSGWAAPWIPKIKEHGVYVPLKPYYGEQLYKNMTIIGTLPGSEIKAKVSCHRDESPYSGLYGNFCLSRLKDIAGDKFFVVNATTQNYYKTVQSWDIKPDYVYKDNAHAQAMVFFAHYYRGIMSDCVATSEEISSYIDWTKSPGWPHTYFGFKTKAELVDVITDTMFEDRIKTLPIWNGVGKIEFRAKEDIDADKIRLFQVPPYDLLYSQLKFGKRISQKLMLYLWSAYGFNPYSGGFDNLARRLLQKRFRGCYDVSGWDKFLPLLKEIFGVLEIEADLTPEQKTEFDWMVENTCNFLLKLLNGHVIRKTYGNPSGSGTTTRDNIFGHVIIFASGLYSAYYAKNGCWPSAQMVAEQIVFLYGDDNVFSLDEDFSLMCDEKFLSMHLAKYGLKLKFFYGGLDCDLHVLSFLGASFKKIDDYWYPLYDIQRLATTMVYQPSKMTIDQHLSKAFTLMVMSYPSEHFDLFYESYKNLIRSSEVLQASDHPVVKAYVFVGLPEKHSIKAFYQGSEAGWQNLELLFSPDMIYPCA